MTGGRSAQERALTAVLVARDRDLAGSFLAAAAECRVFEILAELKEYRRRRRWRCGCGRSSRMCC